MIASVGRIVHFKIADRCVAAIVTEVRDGNRTDLTLFPPTDLAYGDQANIAEGNDSGSWHEPERVFQ